MKKTLLGSLTLLSVLVLGACSGGDSGKTVESKKATVEKTEESTTQSTKPKEESGEEFDLNQEIVNDDNVKATLLKVEHIKDKTFNEEYYEISFDVENKRKDTITAQAREVSLGGRMVDESLLMMSTDIAGGKVGTAKLRIQDYSGGELPELTGKLEMTLHVFNQDYKAEEFLLDAPVSVDIK